MLSIHTPLTPLKVSSQAASITITMNRWEMKQRKRHLHQQPWFYGGLKIKNSLSWCRCFSQKKMLILIFISPWLPFFSWLTWQERKATENKRGIQWLSGKNSDTPLKIFPVLPIYTSVWHMTQVGKNKETALLLNQSLCSKHYHFYPHDWQWERVPWNVDKSKSSLIPLKNILDLAHEATDKNLKTLN